MMYIGCTTIWNFSHKQFKTFHVFIILYYFYIILRHVKQA